MIEAEVPDAAYWSFHLYADNWFEVPDRETRVTTRNHTQTAISDDGLIRLVVSGRDPGVANWIDTSDRDDRPSSRSVGSGRAASADPSCRPASWRSTTCRRRSRPTRHASTPPAAPPSSRRAGRTWPGDSA